MCAGMRVPFSIMAKKITLFFVNFCAFLSCFCLVLPFSEKINPCFHNLEYALEWIEVNMYYMKQRQKLCSKKRMVIDRRKGNMRLNEGKPVENINKNPQCSRTKSRV